MAPITKTPRNTLIRISALHDVVFRQVEPPSPYQIQLTNLSTEKIGFMRNTSAGWPAVGSTIKGVLQFALAGKQFPVELEIQQISSRVVECEFLHGATMKDGQAAAELRDTISEYFKVELGAIKMLKVNPTMVKAVPDGTPHWFYGENNCSLYFVESAGRILRFNLSFFGNYVEGGEGKATRFGRIVGDEPREEFQYKGATEVRWEESVPADLTDTLSKFLFNIGQLSPAFRFAIAEMVGK